MSQFASQGYVEKDGVTLIRSTSIEVDQATNNADVDTIVEGYAGNTVGTKKYTVKLSNPVPAEGFEVNWMEVCERSETHQLRFVLIRPAEAGGGILWEKLLEGDFRDPSINVGVNKAVDSSVSFHGKVVA